MSHLSLVSRVFVSPVSIRSQVYPYRVQFPDIFHRVKISCSKIPSASACLLQVLVLILFEAIKKHLVPLLTLIWWFFVAYGSSVAGGELQNWETHRHDWCWGKVSRKVRFQLFHFVRDILSGTFWHGHFTGNILPGRDNPVFRNTVENPNIEEKHAYLLLKNSH